MSVSKATQAAISSAVSKSSGSTSSSGASANTTRNTQSNASKKNKLPSATRDVLDQVLGISTTSQQQNNQSENNAQQQNFYGRDQEQENEQNSNEQNKTSGFYGKQEESVNGREAAERAAQQKAVTEYQLKQKQDARQKAADATAEADRLEAEMAGKYGYNPVATNEEEAASIADTEKRIAENRSKAEAELAKVNTTNSKRDAAVEEYLKAVDTERTIADGATILNQAELDAASANRKQKEEALKEINRALGNDLYYGLVDEAQSRDLFEGWAGDRVASSAAIAGTALQWLDQASDDMVRYEYDQEHGEGTWDKAIAGKNVNQIGDFGEMLFNAGKGWAEQAQSDWASGTENMTDSEKEVANMGRAAADMTMDMIENFIVPGAGRVAMGLRVAGQGALTQDQRENNDIDTRMAKAAFDGAAAFLSEYLMGGAEAVYGKSVFGKAIKPLMEKLPSWASPVLKTVLNTEGVDEVMEYGLTYLGDKYLGFDQNAQYVKDEAKENFLVGYIMGVIFNGIAGGLNYDASKMRAVVDEAAAAYDSGKPLEEIQKEALLQPDENVRTNVGKQKAEPAVAETAAEPTVETLAPAAQPAQDSTGTAWTGDWDSWVNAALSGGALSDTDVDTIYNRPAARQAFEEATGISLDGMSEEEAKATIGMAAGTQTIEPTAEATVESGATANNANLTPEENAIVDEIDRVAAERAELQEWNDSVYRPGTEEKYYDRRTGKEVSLEEVQGKAARLEELNNRFDELVEQAPSPERMQQASATAAETEANESTSEAEPEQEANDTGKQSESENNASTNANQDQNQQNQQGQQSEKKEQSRKTDHTKKTTNPNEETDAEFDKLNEKNGSIDKGEKAARDINVPKKDTKGMKVGEGARTIFEADATPDERVASLKAAVVNGNFGHIPVSNDVRSKNAVKKLAKDGWSRSVSDFLAAVDTGKVDADTIAMGAHLLNEAGNSPECSGKQYVELCMAYNDAVSGSAKALAAGRILKTLTPEGKLYGMEKTVEKMNKEIRKANEKRKPGKQKSEIKLNEKLVEDYLNAKTEEERSEIHDKLVKDTAAQVPNTFRDKVTSLRYLNMLGNFKTQFRNLAGNTGMTVVQKVKNEARGGIEWIVKAATGGKYDQQYKGGPGLAKRLKVASEDFVSDADIKSLSMGEKKFSDVAKQSEAEIKDAKKPFSDKNPLGKFLNLYSKATETAMDVGDLIFVRANYADALAGYMNAHNISEADWKAMVNDPAKSAEVDKARAFAIKQAQEATFRDTNAVSKFASTFDQRWGDNGNPVGKAIKKGAQGVIPFRKTPANVLVRMEEYSPLGAINTAIKGFQAAKGAADVSEVIDSAAKSLTGTGLTVLGILAASMGNARTKDEDKNEEALAKLRGQQDYSVEVDLPEFLGGGRQSITMDWLSPASAPFFMGVEAYNRYKDGGFGLADLINATMSITNPMLEMSMLSGVNDALDNLNDFEGDNSALLQFALNSGWSYLTQGISNTMLGQIEQFSEKNRQTYYTLNEEGKLPTSFQKKFAKLGNKTPGIDYQSADYIDAWGRKQANDANLAERAWNVFLNPAYVSKMDKKATEADAVIENLLEFGKTQKERDDFPNVVPRTPSRNETVNGKKLSPEEYDVYATTKGQESLKAVTELSKSDVFKGMDKFAQGEAIHAAYEYAEFLAASKIAKSRGEEYKDSRYDGLEDTDHPAIVVGAKAGFNDAMNHENWDGVDSLLKAANSGKMSNADREFLEDNVDKFWKYSDAAADGLKAKTLNSFDSGVKDLYTSEHRTAENGGDVLDTVVDQYNSGKISLEEADALMGREDRRNENKIHEQLDYELKKVGKGDDDVEKIWSMLEQFDTGEIDKPAIVKEAIKNVPKKEQARIKNVITSWTKTRARAGFGRTTVYNAMRNASDDYTPADIQKFWEIVDANGDGTLSKTEYKNKKSKIPKEYRDDVTKYLYDAMGWK